MRCDECREALSAGLDGVAEPTQARAVETHLAGCDGCRQWAAAAERIHRAVRVRPADPVPDLTDTIMAVAPMSRRRSAARSRTIEWARAGLIAIGVTRLVLAVPGILLGEGAGIDGHVARELASWDLALAVGLLVVAWRPRLATGMLAFALTLAAALAVSIAVDVVGGSVTATTESTHVLELAGVGLVWVLARTGAPPPRRRLAPAGGA
jgi:predicted anti-sigma-YlaC factor YlaD